MSTDKTPLTLSDTQHTHVKQGMVLWQGARELLKSIIVLQDVVAFSQSLLILALGVVGDCVLPADPHPHMGSQAMDIDTSTHCAQPKTYNIVTRMQAMNDLGAGL